MRILDPASGKPVVDEDIARELAWSYVRAIGDERRRKALNLGPAPEPLEDAVERYLEHRKHVVSRNTASADGSALKHLRDVAGESTGDLSVATLQRLIDGGIRAGYAASSVRTWIISIAPFIKWLGMPFDPWDCRLPDPGETEVATWSNDQLAAIRDAADHIDRKNRMPSWPSARLVVETFLGTGVRQQEGFALEWRRISARERTVRVVAQMRRTDRALVPLKGKMARTALILPSFFEHVQVQKSGYVLGLLLARAQQQLITRLLDTARLNEPGIGYHRFRHTYARLCIEQGGRLEELQQFLGHKSIVTTERDYAHFRDDVAASLARQRIYRLG